MAAATVSKPGTLYGPCPDPCRHTDCAESRRTANWTCSICGKPIGYETRYYTDAAPRTYVHAVCYEDRCEAES